MKKIVILVVAACLGAFSLSAQAVRAFPEAEGYGAYASGGRGGSVIYVTHLSDTACATGDTLCLRSPKYVGSLRAALATKGSEPITIMFKVGGTIEMQPSATQQKAIKCNRSNMTIVGQTALGDGICIAKQGIAFSGTNVIIRHMRFRPGEDGDSKNGQSCLWFENGGNFIIDHCSFSWAVEENMTVYDNDLSTIQWSVVSESLYSSYHQLGTMGYAAQWGGARATYHHNLLAHHNSRMPRQNGARSVTDAISVFDYRNNVHYNWGGDGAFYGGDVETARGGKRVSSNIIGNYYVPGPSTTAKKEDQYFVAPSGPPEYAFWYLSGNVMKGNDAKTNNQKSGIRSNPDGFWHPTEISIASTPRNNYAVTTTAAEQAYDDVLAKAGATPWLRDSIDRRIVNEVITQTNSFVGSRSTNSSKNKGIIDSHWDCMPEGKDSTTWDAWKSNYRNVTLIGAPDTFLVENFVDGVVKTKVVKMSRVVDTDGDGIPDWWETANGLNPVLAEDGNGMVSGYTKLEVYLNSFPHADAPADEVISGDDEDAEEPTGIVKSEAQPYLRIYPNPVSTGFNIETILEPKTVEIYSMSGQRVASFPAAAQSSYSVALLHRGVYFVRVLFTNGSFATQRMVK